MAILDPMAELEALVNEDQKSTGAFTPFFFSIKDGTKGPDPSPAEHEPVRQSGQA